MGHVTRTNAPKVSGSAFHNLSSLVGTFASRKASIKRNGEMTMLPRIQNTDSLPIVRLNPSRNESFPQRSSTRPISVVSTEPNSELSLTFTLAELAHHMRCSERTIRRMDESGQLPRSLRMGSKGLRWQRSAIELWLKLGTPSRRQFELLTMPTVSERNKA